MSRSEYNRWRSKMQTELHRAALKRQREKIAGLRVVVRETRARQRAALATHRERCKVARSRLREIIKARKLRVRKELAQEIDELRAAARNRCLARRLDITASGKSATAKARARLAVAKDDRREMARIGKIKTEAKSRATRSELRAEDDDRVRSNIESIDPRWVPIWDRVKRQITAAPGRTRTEAFLDWAHHSDVEIADMESTAETAMLSDLEQELAREQRAHAKIAAGKDREHKRKLKTEATKALQVARELARDQCGPNVTQAQFRRCLAAAKAELAAVPF